MSDKSFGDQTNRNVVKNPLLSSAVTGVSIEDLTNKAILLPVTPSQGLITRPEPATLAHDQNANPRNDPPKSTDDFDVSEYFARLQGSRYVSAPLNSQIEELQTEDLEEVNLEDEKPQSLTSDIAQNFSQLPSVLPHVASAVFSSFSNMLSLKSREPVEERQREVQDLVMEPTPMREPPIGGGGNFRIASKMKYAQIPGLSYGGSQAVPPTSQFPPQNNTHIDKPNNESHINFFNPEQYSTNIYPTTSNVNQIYNSDFANQNIYDPNVGQTFDANNANATFPNVQDKDARQDASVIGIQMYAVKDDFGPQVGVTGSKETGANTVPTKADIPLPPGQLQVQGATQVIPPPPMFSSRRDSQTAGKSVLPPSVARRIAGNQPIMKPQISAPAVVDNIFVPTFDEPSVTQNFAPSLPPQTSNPQSFLPMVPASQNEPLSTPSLPINVEPQTIVKPPENVGIFVPTLDSNSTNLENKVSQPELSTVPMFNPATNLPMESPFGPTSRTNIFAPPNIGPPSLPPSIPPASSVNQPMIFTPTLPPKTTALGTIGPNIFTPMPQSSATIEPMPTNQPIQMFTNVSPSSTGPTIFTPTLAPDTNPTVSAPTEPITPISTSSHQQFDPKSIGPNEAAPPIFFNPLQYLEQKQSEPISESKPLIEPPKNTGASNFRMTKKRPQYYSGPIEGVGAISNNVKPIIPPVEPSAFQGVLAPDTSTQAFPTESLEETPQPFDISKPYSPPEYNTVFDLSRPTTEAYDQPQNEPKSFGLIGSLKSKLSAIDINKIQNTVTTFFDPTYNEVKPEEPAPKETVPYEQHTYQPLTQSNFEIFVPTIEPEQNQSYYQSENAYFGQNQYFQQDYYYNQGQMNPRTSYHEPNYVQTQTGIGQQSDYAQSIPAKTDIQIHQDVLDVPLILPETEIPTEYNSNIIIQNKMFDTTHSDKIDISNVQEKGTASEVTSTIPVEIQKPGQRVASDLSARSFFDLSMTSIPFKIEETKSIDLLFGTGDKAQKDNINRDIKTKMDFNLQDPNERGEDKIFDEVLSSILGEENSGTKVLLEEEEIIRANIEETKSLFPEPTEACSPIGFVNPLEVKPIFPATIDRASPEIKIRETNLLESLTTDAIPIVAVSSVPLFGLSTIIADKAKEHKAEVKPVSFFEAPKDVFFDRNASVSFFEHITGQNKPLEDIQHVETTELARKMSQHLADVAAGIEDVSFFDNTTKKEIVKSVFEEKTPSAPEIEDDTSELSICETCREINKPEDKEADDVTSQLIENITSRIQLSNPVEASLTEGDSVENRNEFDTEQLQEITHITEDTIDTINVQSATELLEDEIIEMAPKNYGWCEPEAYTSKALSDHDYSFKLDPNSLGFFGNNSLFFDNVPKNASDEIKAEFKNSHEDMLSRQVGIPSAPPAEDDTKSDETGGLDVHSIEQDAKKDFPIYEDFAEPSETDDRKIEHKEREKSDDPVPEVDSFTNRVERFKKMEEVVEPDGMFEKKTLFDIKLKNSPAISIASYFDTGNYAAETHYRNSLSSPSSYQYSSPSGPIRIPPGFEEEYHRRMSGLSAQEKLELEKLNLDIRYVPETSTQTRTTDTPTYAGSQLEETEVGFDIKSNLVSLVDEDSNTPIPEVKPETNPIIETVKEEKPTLPDPLTFFTEASNIETPETFNRLASYFSSPKEDKSFFDSSQNKTSVSATKPHKSFFELSQGQNHYIDTNIPDDKRTLDIMRDLTSIQNVVVTKEQVVRTVNYFTVQYDKTFDERSIQNVHEPVDENFTSLIDCEFCFKNTLVNLMDGKYKVRQLMNDKSEERKNSDTMETSNDPRRSVTLNLDSLMMDDDAKDGVGVVHESRSNTEYSPVRYHWFYSVDIDEKSIWRGFSLSDSRALEEAFNSSDLNENTTVPTDGGRYDVNVMQRLRTAVYWTEKSTDVSRCSWFYKGPTDARYVPYSETVAEKLEEEYHHGMTTGEWHRRLLLPNNELVVMHGPSVMVHFLHSGTADAFSAPPQSTSRPRVVRRGHDESEIEDTEPSSIDHLLLLCHGVGSACDMRFRSVEEVVDDFRATSLQLVQSHYKNSYDNGLVSRVEVLPISWHSTLHSGETGVDRRLAQITLDSIPRLRSFTNDTVLDVLFYTSPVYCQTIIDTVCSELNRIYNLFVKRNPTFKGRVSLGGHSLGSVILYDLLCHQTPSQAGSAPDKKLVTGPAGTGQLSVKYPKLEFNPAAMYALGSPIAIFECIRGVEALGTEFSLPTCENFFNIFHPYDPIAYRIEPLIHPRLRDVKPSLIPHHKGRKRMHLELKDTMSRVGADLKQKLIESLRTTWNKWMAQPPTDGQLEKVVEEEMEKEQLCDENKEEFEKQLATSGMSGKLNGGRRVDYVLQEAPLELINEYLFAMRSHVGYWESEDTMLLMLREIYDALGVQPDSTLPQQGMTVQRTRTKDDTVIIDHPSTSRGGT